VLINLHKSFKSIIVLCENHNLYKCRGFNTLWLIDCKLVKIYCLCPHRRKSKRWKERGEKQLWSDQPVKKMLQSPSHGPGSVTSSLASTSSHESTLSSSKKVVVCQEVFDEHSQPTYEGKTRLLDQGNLNVSGKYYLPTASCQSALDQGIWMNSN
jgi:hypothetical protein